MHRSRSPSRGPHHTPRPPKSLSYGDGRAFTRRSADDLETDDRTDHPMSDGLPTAAASASGPSSPAAAPAASSPLPPSRLMAVIDVGTSSIRMAIAETRPDGSVKMLESLSQGVRLGRDTFTKGEISKGTIEDCVRVLRSYRHKLDEYQIQRHDQIRVVATSAVREATNQLAFADRIYIATGWNVEVLDESEVQRITYSSVRPWMQAQKALTDEGLIIAEVGGGSTDLLVVESGNIAYSHSYRLGSLRLRQQLNTLRAPQTKYREIMEGEILRQLETMPDHLPQGHQMQMVALGGDMRFLARELHDDDLDSDSLASITVSELSEFVDSFIKLTEDAVIRRYKLSFAEAETAGPAMLVYLELARLLNVEQIYVTDANLRDGILREIAAGGRWTDEFRAQVIRSALELGRKYNFDEDHARQVAELSRQLFDLLRAEHGLDPRFQILLYLAALLHEIGGFVSNNSLHKHSMYLIMNSELFGLSAHDETLVALVARYHRRASPKPLHPVFNVLDRDNRVAVAKMAALLRIAIALDASRSGRVTEINVSRHRNALVIVAPHLDDLSVEQLAIKQARTMFEEVFGMSVMVRTAARSDHRTESAQL